MAIQVRKLSAALLAVIVAVALTFTVNCAPAPVYADDEEEYSAIDISCTSDQYAPLYTDGTKAYKVTVDNSSKVWGKENKDWKLEISAEAVDMFEEWEPVPLSKADGDFTYTAKTKTISLKGGKIIPKIKAMYPDCSFMVNIIVQAVNISKGEVLDSNTAEVFTSEPIADYYFEKDRYLLPYSFNTISHIGEVYVANAKHPDGDFFTYTVTNVVSSDSNIVSVNKDGSDWMYFTEDIGTAVMTVTYKDLAGKTQTYTFEINVDEDVYEVTLNTPLGLATLPIPFGHSEIVPSVIHSNSDGTEVIGLNDLPSGVSYNWSLDKGDDDYAILTEDGDKAVLEFKPDTAEWTFAGVNLEITKNDKVICSDSIAIHCALSYSVMYPQDLDTLPEVGGSVEITPEVIVFDMTHPEGAPVDNVEYTWDYDDSAVKVEETGDGTYSITRLTGEENYLVLSADWIDENEDPQFDLVIYDLPYVSTDLGDYEVMLGEDSSFEWPKIPISKNELVTLDQLDISVIYEDEDAPLSPDKYNIKAFYYDEETDTKEEITTGDFKLEYNTKNPGAGYCDFIIQAVPKDGSLYTGETSEYAGFTLCDKFSIDKFNAEVSFGDEYEAFGPNSWHPYFQIPAGTSYAGGLTVTDVKDNRLYEGTDYKLTYFHRDSEYSETDPLPGPPIGSGHYFVKVEGIGYYTGVTYADFDIGKDNPMSVTGKTKTIKKKKLKKKARTISGAIAVKDAQGKLSYEILTGDAKSLKALTINESNGKIKVKKKTKKGTYSVDVLVSDEGTEEYFAAYDIATVTVKVK